jgi:Ni,Fe-hydrogenase I small subunit
LCKTLFTVLYGCCLERFKFGLKNPDLVVAVGDCSFFCGIEVSYTPKPQSSQVELIPAFGRGSTSYPPDDLTLFLV